jgi:rod shape-determining protein MreC
MAWFSTVLYRNRWFVSFGLALVLFLSILFSPNTFRPFIGNLSASVLFYSFSELKNFIGDLQNVAEQNRRLKLLVTEASLQLTAQSEARRENKRLREFLGFEPPENFRVEPVKIVSLYQKILPIAAIINKGSNDSIMVDQPVINRFGLVGKVTDVMPDFSTIALLTDPTNPVSGRIADSRQIGIVRFSPQEGMYFDNLPADAIINPGEMVITSGLGGVYPSGLAVARVDTAYTIRGDIKKTVRLKPAVNFFEIDELYVLISEPR